MEFNPACRSCPRLYHYLSRLQRRYPEYHNAPVAPLGEASSRLLIVGLAPGLHGANASGIPFVGDHAGDFLFDALRRHGFAGRGGQDDRAATPRLNDCRITNAVKCLPPGNQPKAREIALCNRYLRSELRQLPDGGVIVALGVIAHRAVLRALERTRKAYAFGHLREHSPAPGTTLLDSYHCSRYNVHTGRLSVARFDAVFARARELLDG